MLQRCIARLVVLHLPIHPTLLCVVFPRLQAVLLCHRRPKSDTTTLQPCLQLRKALLVCSMFDTLLLWRRPGAPVWQIRRAHRPSSASARVAPREWRSQETPGSAARSLSSASICGQFVVTPLCARPSSTCHSSIAADLSGGREWKRGSNDELLSMLQGKSRETQNTATGKDEGNIGLHGIYKG